MSPAVPPGPGVAGPSPVAGELPYASVALLVDPPHLDHPFDYLVPPELRERAVPGVRVRVRLAGKLVDGYLLERAEHSQHQGSFTSLHAVVGAAPVLTPEVLALCRAVADRYAGTLADVLRAAVPPRHAAAEARTLAAAGEVAVRPAVPGDIEPGTPAGWLPYEGVGNFLQALERGAPARACWIAGPGEQTGDRIAELVARTALAGRGSVIVVPDARCLTGFAKALKACGLEFEALSAAAGPQARYSSFLRVLTGRRRIVLGTRAAIFAPVVDCGLIVVWDDLDDSLTEPAAPGWHVREVAALRAGQQGCALVIGGHSASTESAHLVGRGWMGLLAQPRERVRADSPTVSAVGDAAAGPVQASRLPAEVMTVVRSALDDGPVLFSVPRAGYFPALSCQRCREVAVCPRCGQALAQASGTLRREPAGARPDAPIGGCPNHGRILDWRCPSCAGDRLRAVAVGAVRTAQEIGRAFPGSPVIGSWAGEQVIELFGAGRPSAGRAPLVVATPGSEPDPGPLGYSAAVILDAAVTLSRPGLRVGEEAVGRWLALASQVRAGAMGGRVLVVGPGAAREIQALIRWDPWGYAQRDLAERRAAGLPPSVRVVALTGPALETAQMVDEIRRAAADLGPWDAASLRAAGPIPLVSQHRPARPPAGEGAAQGAGVRWVLTVDLAAGAQLARAVRLVQARRSARRAAVVRHRFDPRSLS